MDWATYLEHIGADAARLSDVARLGLEPAVPCCPEWTVRDLIGHVGGVYTQKAAIVEEGWTEGQPDRVEPPEDELAEWLERAAEQLVGVLSSHDPAQSVWTHDPSNTTVGFWYRRLAHESLIHRIDAEQAHGLTSEIDEELAGDGVDEVLYRAASSGPSWGTAEFEGRVARLEVPGRSWTVRLGRLSGTSPRSGTEYTDVPVLEEAGVAASFNTVIAGTAGEMDCWLWGRAGLGDLTVQGDRSIAAAVRAVAKRAS